MITDDVFCARSCSAGLRRRIIVKRFHEFFHTIRGFVSEFNLLWGVLREGSKLCRGLRALGRAAVLLLNRLIVFELFLKRKAKKKKRKRVRRIVK